MATVSGGQYDFDFYEYEKNGMVIGESPDIDVIVLLPKRDAGFLKAYMVGLIKNYMNNLGVYAVIRHVGCMEFDDTYSSSAT